MAAGFLALVHQLENVLWDDLPDALGYSSAPWFLVIALPLVGAALVVVARRVLPGDGGHDPLGGLSMEPTALGGRARRGAGGARARSPSARCSARRHR